LYWRRLRRLATTIGEKCGLMFPDFSLELCRSASPVAGVSINLRHYAGFDTARKGKGRSVAEETAHLLRTARQARGLPVGAIVPVLHIKVLDAIVRTISCTRIQRSIKK